VGGSCLCDSHHVHVAQASIQRVGREAASTECRVPEHPPARNAGKRTLSVSLIFLATQASQANWEGPSPAEAQPRWQQNGVGRLGVPK